MKRTFNALLLCALTLPASARDTATAIFEPTFKSLQVLDSTNRLGQPIIRANNSASAITVSFDELAEDNRYLRYRLVHCNSDWQPSALTDSEYLNDFNEAQITDYALSNHPLTHYVHYSLTIPNPDMQPLVSGNYLIEVFDEYDPDKVVLQARFMVDEGSAGLDMAVTSRTDYDYNSRHQQLSVRADLKGARVENPYNDLKLVIVKNGRDNTRRILKHPLSVQSETAVYEHQRELIFPAGNEFRRFDLANLDYQGMGVESVSYTHPTYGAMLTVDYPRADNRYTYDQDQAGRYFPATIHYDDPDINAEYVETYFTLESPQLPTDVFIDGDLIIGENPKMVYDESLGAYVKVLLLKQGMYNYQYITSSPENPIEGDHYETGNEYLALLYYCPPTARYDRLIATDIIFSGK
ncbi:MAG: DUF5103 domain-containing protein [Muribaculaceae bacterium]|nr:DUF5103 domain-containing protein [Muribaculaceae bacterium]